MGNAIQCLIFDQNNVLIAEVEPAYETVSWRLNNTSIARFHLPYTDAKCTETNLRYGNRALIRFENGLPSFGGVVDTPRRRDQVGVTATVYSGEKLLDWRVTPKGRYFSTASPGYIFQSLIQEEDGIGIGIGSIWYGGTARTLEYHYHDLLNRVKDLAKLTGNDFAVLPTYSGGQVTFAAHWYERRGGDKSGTVFLIEGRNVTDVTLDEQGTIGNRIVLTGSGQTWGSERIDSIENDTDSQALYGVREWAEVQSGVTQQATLDANAEELLDLMKDPRKKFTLSVIDKEPGLFAAYGVGDIVALQTFLNAPEWLYDGTVRVMAREWLPNNTCRLEVEEWVS